MHRLAFSTNAFKRNTLPDAIQTIAAIGYPAIELLADVPHAYPPTFTDQNARALDHQLAENCLTVSNVNAFTLFACGDTYHPTWIESDPILLQQRITHTLNAIDLAHRFKSPTVSLQPGGPLIGTTLSRPQAADRFAQALEKVLPRAREKNITLAIEPEPGLFIQSAQEYLNFKNTYFKNDPLIKMNCDLGHLFCVGDDPAQIIHALPDQIAHVHLEDIGANRVHQHLTPGNGVLNFPQIFQALNDVHYPGHVTVELYPYESSAAGVAQAAYTHLRPMLD